MLLIKSSGAVVNSPAGIISGSLILLVLAGAGHGEAVAATGICLGGTNSYDGSKHNRYVCLRLIIRRGHLSPNHVTQLTFLWRGVKHFFILCEHLYM